MRTLLPVVLGMMMLFSARVGLAMPPLNGGAEPTLPYGVNQPDLPKVVKRDVSGEWNYLLILIDFPDYRWNNQDDPNFNNGELILTQEHFRDMLFSDTSFAHPKSRSDYTGSMRDYYREVSTGQFTVKGVVTAWYTAKNNYAYYVGDNFGMNAYPTNSQGLTEEAVNALDAVVDFAPFDNDKDGAVDALAFVHAGPGAEEHGRNETGHKYIWSHKWGMPEQQLDGVSLSTFNIMPQTGSIGVFCHEFGHSLGLPDLYDIDNSSQGLGEWCLMSAGGWCAREGDPAGTCPSHFSGWSKQFLGWVDVQNISQATDDLRIQPVVTSNRIYRLATNGNDESKEYFLLENRRRIGFDSGLTRRQVSYELPAPEGLLITHIDMNLWSDRTNDMNTDEAHRMVDVEEASVLGVDGKPIENLDFIAGSARKLYGSNRGDNGDLWPGFMAVNEDTTDWSGERSAIQFGVHSLPKSNLYSEKPSLVDVSNIRLDGDDVLANISVTPPPAPLLYAENFWYDDTTSGNSNGYLDPGETVKLKIDVANIGSQTAENVFGVIVSGSPLVSITEDSAQYPNIPANAHRVGINAFSLVVSEEASYGDYIPVTLTLTISDTLKYEMALSLYLRPEHEWYKAPSNAVLTGEDWCVNTTSPSVYADNDRAYCWFVGTRAGSSTGGAVGLATSIDGGLTWLRNVQPVLSPEANDVNGISGISVMKLAVNNYLMLYTTQNQANEVVIKKATSQDGMFWFVTPTPVIVADKFIHKRLRGGQLSLFPFMGGQVGCGFNAVADAGSELNVIGAAFTTDKNVWTVNYQLTIMPSMDNNRFDSSGVAFPDVAYLGGTSFKLLFSGMTGETPTGIGSMTTDGSTINYQNGLEAGGAILQPGGLGSCPDEQHLLGARLFSWKGETRMLYSSSSTDGINRSIGLAIPTKPVYHSVPIEKGAKRALPVSLALMDAFPNPFNSTVSITYHLEQASDVRLDVVDLQGRVLATLHNGFASSGDHQTVWGGKNLSGNNVASGTYFIRLTDYSHTVATRVQLIR